ARTRGTNRDRRGGRGHCDSPPRPNVHEMIVTRLAEAGDRAPPGRAAREPLFASVDNPVSIEHPHGFDNPPPRPPAPVKRPKDDMAGYPFKDIESKWQRYWEEQGTFRTPEDIDTSKPKFYVLDMFPYPSGDGLHVGHPEGYTASDIVARYKRMRGFNVLHPIGWDAFGLPAEQYAVRTGTHPKITTERNIERFRKQLKSLGLSFDWSREVNTTDPAYYKWT